MVSNGKSLENGWFRGTTILGNLHVYYSILYHDCHKGRKWVKLDSSTRSTLFIQPLSLPQRPWLAQSSSRCRPRCLVQYFTFLSDLGSAIHISKQLYDFCIYICIYIHIIYICIIRHSSICTRYPKRSAGCSRWPGWCTTMTPQPLQRRPSASWASRGGKKDFGEWRCADLRC